MEYNDEYELEPDVDLGIDPERLDVQWMQQATLFNRYAKMAAQAERIAKQAHENVKIVRSKLVKKANRKPDKYLGKGIKPTATNVEAYYRKHAEHIDAKNEWIEAEYEHDVLQGQKSAMYMKKTALENILKLAMQGWFAAPMTPKSMKELKNQLEETEKRTTKNMVRKAKEKGKMTRGSKK